MAGAGKGKDARGNLTGGTVGLGIAREGQAAKSMVGGAAHACVSP